MCLIFVAWHVHHHYSLVVVANRDELHTRVTKPAHWWQNANGKPATVLAGRDWHAGGTWIGITRSGRFAAITNFRHQAPLRTDVPSRGELVSDFLRTAVPVSSYLASVNRRADRFNPFSLLLAENNALGYVSSHDQRRGLLRSGVYGLSNHRLNTPWFKINSGKQTLIQLLADDALTVAALMAMMREEGPIASADSEEYRQSSPFVRHPIYGTRATTVLLLANDGEAVFYERRFNADGHPIGDRNYSFLTKGHIEKPQWMGGWGKGHD